MVLLSQLSIHMWVDHLAPMHVNKKVLQGSTPPSGSLWQGPGKLHQGGGHLEQALGLRHPRRLASIDPPPGFRTKFTSSLLYLLMPRPQTPVESFQACKKKGPTTTTQHGRILHPQRPGRPEIFGYRVQLPLGPSLQLSPQGPSTIMMYA